MYFVIYGIYEKKRQGNYLLDVKINKCCFFVVNLSNMFINNNEQYL